MDPYQPPAPQQDPSWQGHPSGPIPLPRQPAWPETPLGWAGPQPPIDPGPPKRGGNTGLIVAVVVVVLLALGGAGWFVWHRLSATTPTDTAATATATDNPARAGSATAGSASAGAPQAGGKTLEPGGRPAPSATSPSPAPDAEQAALLQLQELRDASVAVVPLDGRWVAQLASKSVGITDPLQTAANGTHTFYAGDILAEVANAQAEVGGSAQLYVLWGTDFGKRSTAADGSPYWTTVADAGFASEDDVTEWCSVTFPGLSADQLADQCTPRQLTAPHD